MNGNTGLRIVSALVLVAVIGAIAFFAYQAGVAQGSPITIEAPSGESGQLPYPYYGYGFHHRPFGFGFGLFGFFFVLFLIFVGLKAMRFLFWGPRWGWGHHRGAGGRHWEKGVPPMFEDWHKRAHGEQPEDRQE